MQLCFLSQHIVVQLGFGVANMITLGTIKLSFIEIGRNRPEASATDRINAPVRIESMREATVHDAHNSHRGIAREN